MKKLCILLTGIIIVTSAANAQHIDRSKFITDSLDTYINKALTNWRIPGAAICIVKDGKIVKMKGYGIKELGLNNKVDENTLFMIGSNTKAFTATALAMLQVHGKLSLDDKVTKYLPQWKLDNQYAGQEAMVRDLLCHRIGFRTFQGDFTFYNSDLTREQIIEKMSHVKAAHAFRTTWGYTNSAFLTAGQIIPVVTGKPWETYLKENIFAPLGMGNTVALTADMPKSINRTVPHILVNVQLKAISYAQIDGLAPAGAISSSVNDLSKWVMAQLNNGKVGPRQVIPAAAIEATREPQDVVGTATNPDGSKSYMLYGLGWGLDFYNNHRVVMLTGGVIGYLTSVTLLPDDQLGIVVLTYSDQNEFFEALKWDILDAYLKKPFSNYSAKFLSSFKAQQNEEQKKDILQRDTIALNRLPQLPVSQYTGKYANDLYGSMTVTQGALNDLEMRFEHHPKMFARLQPLGGNRFYVTFSDPVLGKAVFPFTVENGKVTAVKVKVADFVEYDPYDFKKVQ